MKSRLFAAKSEHFLRKETIIFLFRPFVHAEHLLFGGPCGGIAFYLEWGIDLALPHGLPHSLSCGLPFLRPQSGTRQLVRLLPFGSAAFLASFRLSDGLLLRLFFVGPVLHPGLNSIHFTSLMTHFGAVRFPPFRRFGARDGFLVCSALLSLLAF